MAEQSKGYIQSTKWTTITYLSLVVSCRNMVWMIASGTLHIPPGSYTQCLLHQIPISVILLSLSCIFFDLPMGMADWKCWYLLLLGTSTNTWWKQVNKFPGSLALCWGNSEGHTLHEFPEFPRRIKLQLTTAVTCLIMHSLLIAFSSPSHFSISLAVFPGFTA